MTEVEKPPTAQSGDIEVFSVEEVMALGRAATSGQDAAIYLTAALTGLRAASCSRCAGATWISRARSSAESKSGWGADIQTTMKYLHYAPREGDAALVAEAFRAEPVSAT